MAFMHFFLVDHLYKNQWHVYGQLLLIDGGQILSMIDSIRLLFLYKFLFNMGSF